MEHPDPKNFFIGKAYDLKQGKLLDEAVLYNPSDLTTHAVVTGMTGSGKTGLCIGMLEEAALKGLPAIIIDPKGDLTNLVLHFPDLAPSDFEPWIDPDTARLKGKSVRDAAQEAAASWSTSIDEWDLSRDALRKLKEFDYIVYTPESTSGIPVDILSSLGAPSIPWSGNEEQLRDQISSIVTALLGLAGLNNFDPIRSREHILLSQILEQAWCHGKGLTLTELIINVQEQPIKTFGALPLERFFPEKDRIELAMLLNNFLASPSFRVWQQGQPLDIKEILYNQEGKPRHSIFYLSHLSENERMFFVTLLFSAIESWMRRQRGTSGLRALVYFDEILGYLPPVANPPSKEVILRMITQARAFGVGIILATQNPADIDYKALSNIGTWFIGRLQTERDKMKLMDGLENIRGGIESNQIGDNISSLGKRIFLMKNVNNPRLEVFHARQVLNYLAGPLSKDLIPRLNELAGAVYTEQGDIEEVNWAGSSSEDISKTRPAVPSKIDEFFLPASLAIKGAIAASGMNIPVPGEYEVSYKPAFIAQAEVRFTASRLGIDKKELITGLSEDIKDTRTGWEESVVRGVSPTSFGRSPQPGSMFAPLPDWLSDPKVLKECADDFSNWLYRSYKLTIMANEGLKMYAAEGESRSDFLVRCRQKAGSLMEAELDKIEDTYDRKKDALEDRIRRQEGEVMVREQKVSRQSMETWGTAGATLLEALMGRRRSIGSTFTKSRMSAEARSLLTREKGELEDMKDDLEELERELEAKQDELAEKYERIAGDITEVPYMPKKSDIYVSFYGIAWLPHYTFSDGNFTRQVRAFSLK